MQRSLYHYFDHSNIKASQTLIMSNSKILISSVDLQSIQCRLGVSSDVTSGFVGLALMLSGRPGFGCAAPCQYVTGSLKHGSVSLGHRLMDLISSQARCQLVYSLN